jgi:hypothetical protein
VAYTWTVLPKAEVILWPDTTQHPVFSSGTKRQNYIIILTASYAYLEGDKVIQKSVQAVRMIQVGEAGGNPGTVSPPVNLSGLAKQAYEWTALVEHGNEFKDEAKKLADSFNVIAKKIEDGHLTTVNDIFTESKTANDNSLRDARAVWLPWFIQMTAMLKGAYQDNSIRTPQQYASAWRQIAQGLETASR